MGQGKNAIGTPSFNAGCWFGCRQSVTAVALTTDETTAYSVSKDGSIVATDVETGSSNRFADAGRALGKLQESGRAEWVAKQAARGGGAAALLAAAVSSDGRYLAVGGGDRKVHIWDARSRQYIQVGPVDILLPHVPYQFCTRKSPLSIIQADPCRRCPM